MTTINNDLTKTTLWENRKSILICSIVATASFQYGLDFSLIGGFQAMEVLSLFPSRSNFRAFYKSSASLTRRRQQDGI
jgi:hypothetical protein